MAGAALGAHQVALAQHLEHLRLVLRRRCSTWSTFIEARGSPATIDYFGRRFVLCGRRALCVAGAILRGLRVCCPQSVEVVTKPPHAASASQASSDASTSADTLFQCMMLCLIDQ